MPETKKISVIIPVYNVRPYLEKYLDSVITQAYRNMEIIMVDDGSTDGSGAICDEYASKDPRIIVIHKKNGGLSSARNAGLDIATGDAIAFVDSDDWLGEDAYTKVIATQEQTGADIVQFGYYLAKKNFCKKQEYVFDADRELSKWEALNLLLEDKYIQNYAWNKLYVKDLFTNLRFPTGKVFEDIFINYKLFLRVDKMAILADHFKYYYRQRRGSIVNTKSFKGRMDAFEATWLRYQNLKDNHLVDKESLFINMLRRFIKLHLAFSFRYSKAFKKRFRRFLAENKTLNEYHLNKSHKLYLRLPFPVFLLLYNGVTRRIGNIVKFLKKKSAGR
jgi:glycosyltransferase involved in cell wall biosynthesis